MQLFLFRILHSTAVKKSPSNVQPRWGCFAADLIPWVSPTAIHLQPRWGCFAANLTPWVSPTAIHIQPLWGYEAIGCEMQVLQAGRTTIYQRFIQRLRGFTFAYC